jgi:hypothetical protein
MAGVDNVRVRAEDDHLLAAVRLHAVMIWEAGGKFNVSPRQPSTTANNRDGAATSPGLTNDESEQR